MKPQAWRIRYKGTRSLVIGAVDKPRQQARKLREEGRKVQEAIQRLDEWLKGGR